MRRPRMAAAGVLLAGAALLASAVSGLGADKRPTAIARYAVVADGRTFASFTSFRHMASDVPANSRSESSKEIRRVPGSPQAIRFLLRRRANRDDGMMAWQREARSSLDTAIKDVRVVAFDPSDEPVAAWRLTNAIPSRIEFTQERRGADLRETVTLTAQGVEPVKP